MKVFKRDYTVRIGSTFSEVILLEDIYIELDPLVTYTLEGGMILVSDDTKKIVITPTLSLVNTTLTLTMTATITGAISDLGLYNYAVDITASGIVQTVLEGNILVKDDVSKPAA